MRTMDMYSKSDGLDQTTRPTASICARTRTHKNTCARKHLSVSLSLKCVITEGPRQRTLSARGRLSGLTDITLPDQFVDYLNGVSESRCNRCSGAAVPCDTALTTYRPTAHPSSSVGARKVPVVDPAL